MCCHETFRSVDSPSSVDTSANPDSAEGPRAAGAGSHEAGRQAHSASGACAVPEDLRRKAQEIISNATSEVLRQPPERDVVTYGAAAWLVPVHLRIEVVKVCNDWLSLVDLPLLPEPKREEQAVTPRNVLTLRKTLEGLQELVGGTMLRFWCRLFLYEPASLTPIHGCWQLLRISRP